ncbi:MAG TPA: GNAT family N-acetyltransferase [Pyrinomonadaceae bacterium]|jgi:N-acetylglutamate synthase-like GNAT family acetyltransferase
MLNIRRARQEDKEAIWRVHGSAIRGTCASHYSREVIEVWAGRLRAEKYAEAIDKYEFFVAEEDGVIVGFGELGQEAGAIQGLYVSPDAAGRGVGRELLRTLEGRAHAHGLKSLSLTSSLNAVTFYERAGFEAVEELTETISPGVERASVRMFKELGSG